MSNFYEKVDNIDVIKNHESDHESQRRRMLPLGQISILVPASTNSYPELFTIVRGACRVSIRPLTL